MILPPLAAIRFHLLGEAKMKLRTRLRLAGAMAFALLLAACQTGEVFVSPPLNAVVIDGRTGAPLEKVMVTMWSTEDTAARQEGGSDGAGVVKLPRLVGRLHAALPFVADRVLPPAIARFERPGYVAKEINSSTDAIYFAGAKVVELSPVQ